MFSTHHSREDGQIGRDSSSAAYSDLPTIVFLLRIDVRICDRRQAVLQRLWGTN